MGDVSVLEKICEELVALHRVHTILLYGSRADGTATDDSDFDVAAFGLVTEPLRIARQDGMAYWDVWVYPEESLAEPTEESLRLRGSRIIMQRDTSATEFLGKIEALYSRGPKRLSANEIEARGVWAHKMLARMRRADPEGNYRRIWLLQALLEDYFHRRGLWFEGPKKALRWLEAPTRLHTMPTVKPSNLAQTTKPLQTLSICSLARAMPNPSIAHVKSWASTKRE